MASLNMFLAPISSSTTSTTSNITCSIPTSMTTRRARSVQTFATAAKGSGGSSEEKGFLDWLSIALQKDSFVETDPILQKTEEKSTGTVITGKKTTGSKTTGSAAAAPKKSGGGFPGLGGLFAKK